MTDTTHDDLVKRLRDLGDHASFEPHMHHTAADRIEELEAKLAKAVELLEAWLELSWHCSIEEGVCCCGDNMENHTHPMDCGHMPLDHGAYIAGHLEETTRTTLAELKGQGDG